jgi:filamentous hemagglutinin family protein
MKSPRIGLLATGLLALGAGHSLGNPEGGQVAAGSATINTVPGTVTVQQQSNTAIINWQSFSIGAGELTKFIQPSANSAALNRVLGGQTSIIDGTLSANGQIYLINGNGIVVGPGGVINTAGFTGSTRDINDADFLSGNLHFAGSSAAGVQNLGTINALGGDVYLIGHTVDNQGTINAPNGTAGLAAADDVLISQAGVGNEHVFVSPSTTTASGAGKTGVHNSGAIAAASAELKAANGNIYALAINNEGTVRATTVQHQGGRIFLVSDRGTVRNSGTLDASATAVGGTGGSVLVKTQGTAIHTGTILAQGGTGGTGGNAEISGKSGLTFSGSVNLTAPHGKTGTLTIDPPVLTVATLDVITGGTGSINSGTNQNASPDTTIDPLAVDAALTGANVTLNADTSITIDGAIYWESGTTLTLSTNTAGSTITINAPITGINGGGGLVINAAAATDVITTGPGTSPTWGTIQVGSFILQRGAWTQNQSTLPAFVVTGDFEIGNGSSFIRVTGGNGSSGNPYQIVDVYGLQGIAFPTTAYASLSSYYQLASTIDASTTSSWNSGAGFVPIGTAATPFTGNFDGQFNSINSLTIDLPTTNNVGLFGQLSVSAKVQNLNIENATVTGQSYVGVVTGDNLGIISNGFFSGNVYGSGTGTGNNSQIGGVAGQNDGTISGISEYVTVNGGTNVGGVTGKNTGIGVIDGSSFAGSSVTATGNYAGGLVGYNLGSIDTNQTDVYLNGVDYVGGLAGYNGAASISNSSALGQVSASGNVGYVGGLVGYNATGVTIQNSYATGNLYVSGNGSYAGGLVGYSNTGATIKLSFATGNVTLYGNGSYAAGLVGYNDSTSLISQSYAMGQVYLGGSGSDAGGLAGHNSGSIVQSFAEGSVYGNNAGGLVGVNATSGKILQTYAIGSVDGPGSLGGLVADNHGAITESYATGQVNGGFYSESSSVDGLVGINEGSGTVTQSYWDGTTTGFDSASGIGVDNNSGTTITAELGGSSGLSPYTTANYTFFGTGTPVTGGNSTADSIVNNNTANSTDPNYTKVAWYTLDGSTRPFLAWEAPTSATTYITNSHELQLMAINLNPGFTYTLGINSFQASDTNGYDNPSSLWTSAGFVPVGDSSSSPFKGSFYGNYDTIYNLYINSSADDYVGLFGYVGSTGSLSNVNIDVNIPDTVTADDVGGAAGYVATGGNLSNVTTSGTINGYNNVGGVIGFLASDNTLSGNSSSASVSGNNNIGGVAGYVDSGSELDYGYGYGTVTGNNYVGGFVGYMNGSELYDNSASANVTGITYVGGLVGFNASTSTIDYGFASNSVNSYSDGTSDVGGLVGENDGTIQYSSASASVYAEGDGAGGLVGENDGTIQQTYASGNVTASSNYVGGLVGDNYGSISMAYATGSVDTGNVGNFVGGLVGANESTGTIDQSFYSFVAPFEIDNFVSFAAVSTPANINGHFSVGGLVGDNNGIITRSYSTGTVSGVSSVGGLVGDNLGSVQYVYATGSVTGSSDVGALVGTNDDEALLADAFWDSSLAGGHSAVGSNYGFATTTNLNGLVFTPTTPATLTKYNGFDSGSGFSPESGGSPLVYESSDSSWRIAIGMEFPLLTGLSTEISGIDYKHDGTTPVTTGTVTLNSGYSELFSTDVSTTTPGAFAFLLPADQTASGLGYPLRLSDSTTGGDTIIDGPGSNPSGVPDVYGDLTGVDLWGHTVRVLTDLSNDQLTYADGGNFVSTISSPLPPGSSHYGGTNIEVSESLDIEANYFVDGDLIVDKNLIVNAPLTLPDYTVTIRTTGSCSVLTLNEGITSQATGLALVLATDGTLVNNVGSTAISTPNGYWEVDLPTDADTGNTYGPGGDGGYLVSGNTAVFSTTPGTVIGQTGNRYVFAETPLLTVTPNTVTNTYGQNDTAGTTSGGYTITGFVVPTDGAFTMDDTTTATTGTVNVSYTGPANWVPVGTYAYLVPSQTLSSPNGYGFTYANGNLTITPSPTAVSVTINDSTQQYGSIDPSAFTFTATGLPGDPNLPIFSTNPTLSSQPNATATVLGGPYAITGSGGVTPNYSGGVNFTNGQLYVTPAPLQIIADNKIIFIGSPLPTLTATGVGLVNGDSSSIITGLTTTALADSPIGNYLIDASETLANSNYNITRRVNGTLVISEESRLDPFILAAFLQFEASQSDYGRLNPYLKFLAYEASGGAIDGDGINTGEGPDGNVTDLGRGSFQGQMVTPGNGFFSIIPGAVVTTPLPPGAAQQFQDLFNAGSNGQMNDAAFGSH